MTNELSTERAIEALYTVRAYYASLTAGYPKGKDCRGIGDVMCSEIANSCLMAIKALEQQPSEDCISREQAVRATYGFERYTGIDEAPYEYAESILKDLPSVTPSYNSIKTELKPCEDWKFYYKHGYTQAKRDLLCEDCISREALLNSLKGFEILHNHDELRSNLIYGIMNLPSVTPQQTRWIPVSERLPKTDEDVLVTNGIGMYVGWIDPTDKNWRVDSESEYFMEDIIAWMPLPELYKEESEEV